MIARLLTLALITAALVALMAIGSPSHPGGPSTSFATTNAT